MKRGTGNWEFEKLRGNRGDCGEEKREECGSEVEPERERERERGGVGGGRESGSGWEERETERRQVIHRQHISRPVQISGPKLMMIELLLELSSVLQYCSIAFTALV